MSDDLLADLEASLTEHKMRKWRHGSTRKDDRPTLAELHEFGYEVAPINQVRTP